MKSIKIKESRKEKQAKKLVELKKERLNEINDLRKELKKEMEKNRIEKEVEKEIKKQTGTDVEITIKPDKLDKVLKEDKFDKVVDNVTMLGFITVVCSGMIIAVGTATEYIVNIVKNIKK